MTLNTCNKCSIDWKKFLQLSRTQAIPFRKYFRSQSKMDVMRDDSGWFMISFKVIKNLWNKECSPHKLVGSKQEKHDALSILDKLEHKLNMKCNNFKQYYMSQKLILIHWFLNLTQNHCLEEMHEQEYTFDIQNAKNLACPFCISRLQNFQNTEHFPITENQFHTRELIMTDFDFEKYATNHRLCSSPFKSNICICTVNSHNLQKSKCLLI